MTIIEQPASLSLSRNLKKFIVKSAAPFTFVLKKGNIVLTSQRYTPGTDQRVIIDVQDIIHSSMTYDVRLSNVIYEQKDICAEFVAVIDKLTVQFKVMRGGVDMKEDDTAAFLEQNWLTWQPTVKKTNYHQPEFLTYYAVTNCEVKACIYLSELERHIVTLGQLQAGKAYTIPVQCALMAAKVNSRTPGAYDVWIENAQGYRMSYVQRYLVEGVRGATEHWFLFENSLGGIDSFRATGSLAVESQHTHNIAEVGATAEEYHVDTTRLITKYTGFLSKEETRWLLDFFPSLGKYILSESYLRKITVTESNVEIESLQEPTSFSFTFKYADSTPLLTREASPLPVIHISIPTVGLSTLKPRLAEVQRLSVDSNLLIPVQQAYTDSWGATTIGELASAVAKLLTEGPALVDSAPDLSLDVITGKNEAGEPKIYFRIHSVVTNGFIQFVRKKRNHYTKHNAQSVIARYNRHRYSVMGLSLCKTHVGVDASTLTPGTWYEYPINLSELVASYAAGSPYQFGLTTKTRKEDIIKFKGSNCSVGLKFGLNTNNLTVLRAGLQYNVLEPAFLSKFSGRKIFKARGEVVPINVRMDKKGAGYADGYKGFFVTQ